MNNVYIKREDILNFDCIREETLERIGIKKDILSIEDLLVVLEELYADKERLEEELDDIIQDVRDNYKPISPYEKYGVSERDFI